MKILILAGGSGTRLWPLSRTHYPKQFIKLPGKSNSLFQETFERSLLLASIDDIYVVTNNKYKFLVMGEVEELGHKYNESNIIIEPEPKSTLPAIYAGIYEIQRNAHDFVVVFPSDHVIEQGHKFAELIKASEELANQHLVTFGIKPDAPNTGYGYICPSDLVRNGYIVNEFKEKPDLETAKRYISNGYLWNSGIFMFNTELFLDEVRCFCPEIFRAFRDNSNLEEVYSNIQDSISIDYGLMEKSTKVAVVEASIGWNDLGSFDSFYDVFEKDDRNNIVNPENISMNSSNNLIYSESGKLVVTVGVDDLIIIDNRDALLVCKKDQSQKVKDVVDTLKKREDLRTEYHLNDYRPWGHYKVLEERKSSFKIKLITINEGKRLSYQLHQHRSEHWVVVKGKAKVTIDDEIRFVYPGESIYMKPGQKHQLENAGDSALEIIEVQLGDYLEEDDIVRFNEGGN